MTGDRSNMPEDLIEYMSHLELVRAMYDKYVSKTAIIKVLRSPVYGYTDYMARKIFNDALNFFYADNGVKREAWGNIYADKLDNLALLAIESDDWEGARRCMSDAAKLRMGEDQKLDIPLELLDRRPVFYTLNPEDVGLPGKVNRHKLAAWIDKLPDIDADDRKRIHRDANSSKSEGNVFDIPEDEIEYLSKPGDADDQEEN
jgi:hypothetical protein